MQRAANGARHRHPNRRNSHGTSLDDYQWAAYEYTDLGDAIMYTAEAAQTAFNDASRPISPDRQVSDWYFVSIVQSGCQRLAGCCLVAVVLLNTRESEVSCIHLFLLIR